ncbi:MAG: tail fiber domain-containing protein [Sphingobacteriales bacterium]|nr:tail fiber domain-containing protein [Sphingobacteriales bacterium]
MKYLSYYLSVIIIICAAATTQAQQVFIQNVSNLNYSALEAYTYNNAINSYGAYLSNTGNDAYTKYGLYNYTYNDGTGNSYGVYGYNNSWGTGTPYAGYFQGSYNSNVPVGYGIYATSTGATNNWAGYFQGKVGVSERVIVSDQVIDNNKLVLWQSYGTTTATSNNCHSIGTNNYMMRFNVPLLDDKFHFYVGADSVAAPAVVIKREISSTSTYAAYKSAKLGIGWSDASVWYNLDVNGKAYCTGGIWETSDRNFKKDIKKYDSALETIAKLQAYTYQYDRSKAPEYNFDEREHIGYLAQDLQKIVPQAVMEDGKGKGFLAVNYNMIIPVISEAVKELASERDAAKTENSELKNKVSALENKISVVQEENNTLQNRLDALESSLQKMNAAMQNCCLSDKTETGSLINDGNSNNYSNAARLEQNAPNPFYAKTIIQHYVPEEANSAQLQITALDGKVMKSINLGKGFSTTTINGSELAAGTYIYALIIDGKNTATKEMILTK